MNASSVLHDSMSNITVVRSVRATASTEQSGQQLPTNTHSILIVIVSDSPTYLYYISTISQIDNV